MCDGCSLRKAALRPVCGAQLRDLVQLTAKSRQIRAARGIGGARVDRAIVCVYKVQTHSHERRSSGLVPQAITLQVRGWPGMPMQAVCRKTEQESCGIRKFGRKVEPNGLRFYCFISNGKNYWAPPGAQWLLRMLGFQDLKYSKLSLITLITDQSGTKSGPRDYYSSRSPAPMGGAAEARRGRRSLRATPAADGAG